MLKNIRIKDKTMPKNINQSSLKLSHPPSLPGQNYKRIASQKMNKKQLTLGDLIEKLKACNLKNDFGSYKLVKFDFGTAIPTGKFNCWRGNYNELGMNYVLTGYDVFDNNQKIECKINELIKLLGFAERRYSGWKGGEFMMTKDTPIWIANSGNSGNTILVDVLETDLDIILITEYCEL